MFQKPEKKMSIDEMRMDSAAMHRVYFYLSSFYKRMGIQESFCTQAFENLSHIQYNLNGSNTDGTFTVDDSNSFFSPYKILQIAQENKYLGIFFLIFIMELYVVCTH